MSEAEESSLDHFEALCRQSRLLVSRGHMKEALSELDHALAFAHQQGHRRLVDLATCNRASVLLVMGRGGEVVAQMKRILMSSSDPVNKHLAAYNVSVECEQRMDFEKGLFYARLALDHARRSEEPEFVARSLNRLGNGLVAHSKFEEAHKHYDEALQVVGEADSLDRAFILDNIGYCYTVFSDYPAGFGAIFAGLRMLRRLEALSGESQMHLDLCYAYLEIGRLERAERHGLIALRGAEEQADDRQVKNCLYLLGDVAKLSGESRAAYGYFSRLQAEFYPDNGMIPHLLMTNDFRQMVNLRA